MSKWILALLVFSLTVNIAVISSLLYFWHRPDKAGPAPIGFGSDGRQPTSGRPFQMEDSTLTPEQRLQMKQLRFKYHTQMRSLRWSIENRRDELIDLLLAESPDQDSVNAVVTALAEKQIELERLTIDHLLSLKSLMSPEQWEHLVVALEKGRPGFPFLQRMDEMRANRRMGRGRLDEARENRKKLVH